MTTLTCPCCAARFDIEAAIADDAARAAVAAALKLPAPLGDLILRYLGLFRPVKRGLTWDRTAAILNELLAPIHAGQVEWNGRAWAAPLESWRQALTQMLDNRAGLTLPMKSHGYLFKVVAAAAVKAEGAREQQAMRPRAGDRASRNEGGPQKASDVVDRAAIAAGAKAMREALNK